jgi:hypothetical protein
MPREHERIPVSLETVVESLVGKREARISDLSMGGCYVDSILHAQVGETVAIGIRMPNGEWMRFSGIVTYIFPGIGFGVRFADLTDDEKHLLSQVVSSQGGEPFGYDDSKFK